MTDSDTSFVVILDGEKIDVDPMDVDGNEWHLVKQETGLPAKQVCNGVDDLDFDCLAALVWVHVRRTKRDVTIDEVLGGLSIRSIADANPQAGDADPSPSGDVSADDSDS